MRDKRMSQEAGTIEDPGGRRQGGDDHFWASKILERVTGGGCKS